jgi:hypothetical protein
MGCERCRYTPGLCDNCLREMTTLRLDVYVSSTSERAVPPFVSRCWDSSDVVLRSWDRRRLQHPSITPSTGSLVLTGMDCSRFITTST